MRKILLGLSLVFAANVSAQTLVYSEDFELSPLGDFFDMTTPKSPDTWTYNQTFVTPSPARYQILDTGADNNRALKVITTTGAVKHTVLANKEIIWLPSYQNRMILEWDFLTPPEGINGGANCIIQFKLYDSEGRPFIGYEYLTKTKKVSILRAVTEGPSDDLKLINNNTDIKRVRTDRDALDNPFLLPPSTWATFRIGYDVNGVNENGTFFESGVKGTLSDVSSLPNEVTSDTHDYYKMPAKSSGTLNIITPTKTVPKYINVSIETLPALNAPIVSNYAIIDNLKIYEMNLATISTADEPSKSGLSVYPNPSTDVVNINSSVVVQSINVFNANGVLVASNEASQSINIAHLAKGIYYIKYNDAKQNYSQKIMKN